LFQWLADEKLKFKIDRVFPLREAARAQGELEGRRTTGKLVLGMEP
jgi:NADPH:quinone reductase-like Zn-dependent oxidoreductase